MASPQASAASRTDGKPGWTAIALIAAFVFAAVAMFAVGARFVKRSSTPDAVTIAVIPFSDVQPVPGRASAGANFADQLSEALSKVRGLRLAPATEAGTRIEGSIATAGNRVRVAVWLVRAADRRALWTERYEFVPTNTAAVQNEIVRRSVTALGVRHEASPRQ